MNEGLNGEGVANLEKGFSCACNDDMDVTQLYESCGIDKLHVFQL